MIGMNRIESFCRRIGDEFGAHRVVLFGSYAQGLPAQDSDVDLLDSFGGASPTLPNRAPFYMIDNGRAGLKPTDLVSDCEITQFL
jgi:hypothetical protein